MTHITNECPYCSHILEVSAMSCKHCHVRIEAAFPASRLGSLPTEHQRFIEMFVLAAGNLKEMAARTGVSYPTVRSRLTKVIEALRDEIGKSTSTTGTLLDAVTSGASSGTRRAQALVDVESAGKIIKSI